MFLLFFIQLIDDALFVFLPMPKINRYFHIRVRIYFYIGQLL